VRCNKQFFIKYSNVKIIKNIMLENENMKVTERQLRRIIKETIHHMAAAAAASSARGGERGARRRSSKMNTEPDTSSLRSGSASGSSTGTPQDLSGGKAEQMYADLRTGRSKEFFDIVDDIDRYTRSREVTVVMPKETDEDKIVADMKIYYRENQKGGFTKENYDEWVDNVCPILKHSMHFYLKFKEVWEGLSLMPESRLRQIIRSVLSEGGIPQLSAFPADQYDQEEARRLNSCWVKVEPALESVGFTPEQDPFDSSAVQAAEMLGCRPEQLLIYLPEDDFERYDEDTAMMYADAYLAGVDPDVVGENMNGYVLLDVIVPGARKSITQRYIYTCA
jgi:hypothetical protein